MYRTAFSRQFQSIEQHERDMQDPKKRREIYEKASGPDGLAQHEHRSKEAGEEFASTFDTFVNVMDDDRKAYAIKAMARSHRTIQQSFTRMAVAWLEELAARGESAATTDLRNEASMRLGKAFVDNVPEEVRALPFV